ncbi:MAG TPA: heme-binding domain-containing protein, partial [Dongiaceae bacterium]|nr:heme-binding domain-containing protein [Dongiaceae bacterium]
DQLRRGGESMVLRRARALAIGAVAVAIAIQLVPYGRPAGDPPVVREPNWDHPRTRELFFRACRDCHSNETVWPWYAAVAPGSWLMRWDVDDARAHFDVSEWGRAGKNHGDDAAEEVRQREMPLWYYLLLHPAARLSDAERSELVAGLVGTFGDAKEEDRVPAEPGAEKPAQPRRFDTEIGR